MNNFYRHTRVWLLTVLISLCVIAIQPSYARAVKDSIAFIHVNVIPMDTERVLADQTVIIRNGRITNIGPSSQVSVPAGIAKIEGAGKYLIPGLSDTHIHLWGPTMNGMFPPAAQLPADKIDIGQMLFLYIANGVTSVHEMFGQPEHLRVRDRIKKGEIIGPNLTLARLIDGPKKAWPPPISTWVNTQEEARQAVLKAKNMGFDAIKVYSFLSKESYDAIITTAKEVGMPVIGHIPVELSVEYVLKAGQKNIVHTEEIIRYAKGNYSQEQIDYYAKTIAESGIWIAPTLITNRRILELFEKKDNFQASPKARFSHPLTLGVMFYLNSTRYQKISPEHRLYIKNGFEQLQIPITKALQDNGVKLLAGTDAGLPGIFPGYSLHAELEELVGAGLTPYQALKAATAHPAEYLGELDVAGTVDAGKRADLVLLEKNPLKDITNTRKISGVMIKGRWLPASEIQKKLDELAVLYKTFRK